MVKLVGHLMQEAILFLMKAKERIKKTLQGKRWQPEAGLAEGHHVIRGL